MRVYIRNLSYVDALKKKYPVWNEAKMFYLSKNSGENLKSTSSALDETDHISKDEKEEEVKRNKLEEHKVEKDEEVKEGQPLETEDVLLEEPATRKVLLKEQSTSSSRSCLGLGGGAKKKWIQFFLNTQWKKLMH